MAKSKQSSAEVVEFGRFSSADYNDVAHRAALRGINLLNNSYDFDPVPGVDIEKWRLGYGVSVKSCKYSRDEGFVSAIIRYTMTAKYGRKKIVNCCSEFGVFYEVGLVENPSAAEAFCNNVGVFAAYPYFRSLVSSLVWNSGIELPPLPSIASTAHIPKGE